MDTKQCFIFRKNYFLTRDFLFVAGPPIVCVITVQDLKYFRSDPHEGYFFLIYWCDCTLQSLFLFYYKSVIMWLHCIVYFFLLDGNMLY